MKKIILSSIIASMATVSVFAQEEAAPAPLVIGGSVDTYYRSSFNTSDKAGNSAPVSSFANGSGFNIGMINLVASKEGEKSGFVADVMFGPRGAQAGANDDALNVVNQLYAYYNVSDKLTFTMGRFNTFLGYEVISPTGNYNYSTSYMFSYGPFTHTGAKLDYAISENLSLMVAALDQLDFTTSFTDRSQNNMMYGAQLAYSKDALSIYANYLGGNTRADGSDSTTYSQIDLTAGLQATDDLFIGLNATSANQSLTSETKSGFSGVALYTQYAMSDAFSLGFRGEYLSNLNGRVVGLPEKASGKDMKGSVIDLTLSGNYKVGDLTFIPELRADLFSEDNGLNKAGKATKSLTSFTLAAVYAF